MLFRPLLLLAVAGLLLLPDWSAARPFRRRVCSAPVPCPVEYSYPAPPVVYAVPSYPAPIYAPAVGACPPVMPAPVLPGPQVVPERMAEPKAADPSKPVKGAAVEPKPSVIRTVGNEERLPPMPIPVPARSVAEPQPSLPRLPVEFAPPKAITEESQKPDPKSDPLPAFPLLGKEKKEKEAENGTKPDTLPAFDLPPLPALAPPQPATPEPTRIAKSSPLSGEATADVYPVAGRAPADRAAKRVVGFVNKSSRDVVLTIAGKLLTLPSGHSLRVDLPAKFTWQIGGEKEREVIVPDSAPGVDVVIRK